MGNVLNPPPINAHLRIGLIAVWVLLTAGLAHAEAEMYSYQEGDVLPSISVHEGENGNVRVGGTLQFWSIPYLGSESRLKNGDPADSAGFRMRRARLGLQGQYERFVSFHLTLDGLASPSLYEAYLDYRPLSELGLTLGSAKVPYSRFQLDSSSTMRFMIALSPPEKWLWIIAWVRP